MTKQIQIPKTDDSAIAEARRREAEIAFEDELLAAEQRGREFLKVLSGEDIPVARRAEHA